MGELTFKEGQYFSVIDAEIIELRPPKSGKKCETNVIIRHNCCGATRTHRFYIFNKIITDAAITKSVSDKLCGTCRANREKRKTFNIVQPRWPVPDIQVSYDTYYADVRL
jgi:hypothetical protein